MGGLLGKFLRVWVDVHVDLTTDRDVTREASQSSYDVLVDYTTSSDLTDG